MFWIESLAKEVELLFARKGMHRLALEGIDVESVLLDDFAGSVVAIRESRENCNTAERTRNASHSLGPTVSFPSVSVSADEIDWNLDPSSKGNPAN
jgi:hypothetical protein